MVSLKCDNGGDSIFTGIEKRTVYSLFILELDCLEEIVFHQLILFSLDCLKDILANHQATQERKALLYLHCV